MNNDATSENENMELDAGQLGEVSGGGYLNVNVPLGTTEGKGPSNPVFEQPLKGFGRLDEKS